MSEWGGRLPRIIIEDGGSGVERSRFDTDKDGRNDRMLAFVVTNSKVYYLVQYTKELT